MNGPSEAQVPVAVRAAVPLRRNSGFRMLWIGQLLSDTGTNIGSLAYPLLILALTHSAVLAGVVGTARAIARLCLQLPAGALSDRFDRRLTMIVCDSLRAVVLAVLGLLIVAASRVVAGRPGREPDRGRCWRHFRSGGHGGAARDRAGRAARAGVGGHRGPGYSADLAGPALGGVLFGLGRAVPFLADAVSYMVSFGTVSRIRGTLQPREGGRAQGAVARGGRRPSARVAGADPARGGDSGAAD